MTAEGIFWALAIGGTAIGLGVLMRMGIWKSWYLKSDLPPVTMRAAVYALIPIGLGFTLAPILAALGDDDSMWAARLYGVTLAIGTILAIWQPPWVKPAWLRRLEFQYDQDTIKALIAEWRKMDRKEWGALIETQQGLDELVRRAGVPVATIDRRGRPIER